MDDFDDVELAQLPPLHGHKPTAVTQQHGRTAKHNDAHNIFDILQLGDGLSAANTTQISCTHNGQLIAQAESSNYVNPHTTLCMNGLAGDVEHGGLIEADFDLSRYTHGLMNTADKPKQ